MKITRTIIKCIFIITIAFSLSCKNGEKQLKNFPTTEYLSPTCIPINEIIKIGNIYKYKNYIVLQNVSSNAKESFYTYSFPDFKFLYAFCPIGNGPKEYIMPTVIKNTPENIFSFRDHATDKYVSYSLTDSTATFINESVFKPNDNRYFWEINYIRENLYLLKRSNSKISSRELWDFSSQQLLDTLPNTFDLKKSMGNNYYTEFDDTWISSSNSKVAFAYFFIDRIEIGSINGQKLEMLTSIGTKDTPNFHTFKEGKGNYKYNVENNIVHYESLSCTDKYIYALYAGIPWGDIDKNHSSIIEIYNWNGKPIKKLNLEHSLSAFIVDEEHQIIYGINPETHEDEIISYQY